MPPLVGWRKWQAPRSVSSGAKSGLFLVGTARRLAAASRSGSVGPVAVRLLAVALLAPIAGERAWSPIPTVAIPTVAVAAVAATTASLGPAAFTARRAVASFGPLAAAVTA